MRKGNIEAIYRLSPMQEGILFHTLYAPQSGVYFEQYTCRLHGDLNVAAFERAWQEVVKRHPALRTLFTWEQRDQPLQIVRVKVKLPWEHQDWRGFSPDAQQERLSVLLQTDRGRGFKLDQAPLMRLMCIQLTQDAHQFIWSFHHLLLDGWSMRLVLKEVFAVYQARRQSRMRPFRLEPVPSLKRPRPYREYIAWLQQQDLATAETFWKQELKDFTVPTRLPQPQTHEVFALDSGYMQQQIQLPEETTAALESMARTHRLTLNTLLQGAWAMLLSRYSGEEDLIFGTTVSGRPASLEGVEEMIGLFLNTLPVRIRVASNDPIVLWLAAIQTQQVEMRQYDYSPLVDIQKWSDVPPGQPLFESIVVFENQPLAASLIETGSLELCNEQYLERSNYPLAVKVIPGPQLQLIIIYDSRRFGAETITRMLGHLRTLLAGMATNPAQRLSDVPLLTEGERHLMLVEWNDTHVDYPRDWCIHHLFDHQTEQTPNSIAVAFLEEKLTYAELNRRANQLAHYLQSLGIGPEVCVGVCMERSIDMIVGILAVLKAGGAYVPIDPNYPEERLSVILENTQAPVLLTLQSSLDTRHAFLVNPPCQAVCLDTAWERIAGEPETNPISEVTPQNLAYVIYTSGSTGQPKGVQVTHQNLVHSTYARLHYYPEPPTRFLLLSSFAFDSSVAGIFWTLCQGGALILPQERLEQDIEQLGSLIAEHRISHMLTLPSLYNLLLEHVAPHKLQSLQIVMVAGEACPKEAVLRHHMLMPNTTLYNEYGPTEGTVWCTAYQIPTNVAGSQIPIGRPIANMRVYLLDAHGQPVPIGVPGELYIGGDGLARGYLHRPDLTDERFVRPGFSDADTRLYRTGDLARYLPDGNIEFLGRIDHQIKIRGYRVELEEIEAVLAQHPAVRETVVVSREEARIPAGRTNYEEIEALAGQLSAMDEKTADDLLTGIERLSAEVVEIQLAHGL